MKRWAFVMLIAVAMLAGSAAAEEPVYFADPNLKAAVEEALGLVDPTPSDMLGMTYLSHHGIEVSGKQIYGGVTDLTGLEYATNLVWLDVSRNRITDASPLSGLVNLQYLNINNNLISGISALAGMTNLQYLNLHQNQISDISPLSSLTGLQELWILFNGISDISALAGLTNLTTLDLCHNFISDLSPLAGHRKLRWLRIHQASETSADCPLNEEAYCTYLAQIAANNPGIELIYKDNPNPPRGVAASDGTYPDKVHVTWDALCPGPIAEEEEPHTFYYKVYRSDSPSGSKQLISDWLSGTSFDDMSALLGVHYWYWVTSSLASDQQGGYTFNPADEGFSHLNGTLTTTSTAGGTITTPGIGSFQYDPGTTVPVVAAPQANYHFVNWTGTAVTEGKVANPASASTTVTMDGSYTLQANFAIDRRTLTTGSTAGGTVSTPGIGSFQYDHGTTASVAATANLNYHFVNWTGTAVTAGKVANPASASTTVTMDGSYTLQANFAIDRRTLTTGSTAGGTVSTPGIGSFQYDHGTTASVAATANLNYHFVNWTGTAVTAGKVANPVSASTTVTMDGSYTLQANFAIDRRTLTTSATSGGTVSAPGIGSFQYDHGTTASVAATANLNYHFINWTGTAVTAGKVANPVSASTTVTMDGSYTLQANFAIDRRTLTTSATSGGTVSAPGIGSFQYDHGTTVTVAATANLNYHFINWTGAAVTAGKVANPALVSTTVTMDGDYTLVANYAINQHILTTSSNNGGSVTVPGEGSFTYDHGAIVNLVALADAHYHFVCWTGPVTDAASASTTVALTGDTTVQAVFAIDRYTLTVASDGNGSATGSGTYDRGSMVPITATANTASQFVNWTVTGSVTLADPCSASTTVTVNGDGTVTAHFTMEHQTLRVSSTVGGLVTEPGIGTFPYPNGTMVLLQAKPMPSFVFVGWSGTITGTANPLFIEMDADHQMRACFVSLLDVLYVDDNAGGDPGPNDPNLSDLNENGTSEHPFDTLQEAIDVARAGATVRVRPGTYPETINLLGKSIEINGLNADDSDITDLPVIDGQGKDTVVRCTQGEDANCVLAGFVITGGCGRLAGGILCSGSSPSIVNCLIVGNRATDPDVGVANGGAVYCRDSHAAFINCTISGNYGDAKGAGLWFQDGGVVVTNSILWGNGPVEILAEGSIQPVIGYSDVAGGWSGVGNLHGDPLFVRPGRWANPADLTQSIPASDPTAVWVFGDYHLMSAAGRWDGVMDAWIKDTQTSPCIDAGDPASPVGQEPQPNGSRVNMGAYGGTSQASKSGGAGG